MLSVKKKKNLNIWFFLVVGLIFKLVHNWLCLNGEVVENYGISFGIRGRYFVWLEIFFLLFFIIFICKKKNGYWGVKWLFIGGLINLSDRIFLGYVRDYWKFGLVYNNLADWLIGIGVVFLLFNLYGKQDTNNI